MIELRSILRVVLALAAATPAPTSARVDIFPEALLFEARVVRVTPTAWKSGPRNTHTRTVQVEFQIERILKGPLQPPADAPALIAQIAEISKSSGRLEGAGGIWGDADLAPGDVYLIFGGGSDPAAAFSRPTAAYLKRADLPFVEDVEWIVEGEKLDVPSQAARLLSRLEKAPPGGTLFVGRYLAAVAHAASGPARAALLDAISRVESLQLGEDARAESLRALHAGLVMQDKPPADEVQALLASSLQTLAGAVGAPGEISSRVESVVQVYLPWLAKRVPRFPAAALPLVTREQRARVREAAMALAALERFSPESRGALRELAGALK